MKVVLSEHNLEVTEGFERVFNVSQIYVNKFSYWTFDNDIMLIKVSARSNSPLVSLYQEENNLCVSAEPAGRAQRQHPAGCPAGRRRPAAVL